MLPKRYVSRAATRTTRNNTGHRRSQFIQPFCLRQGGVEAGVRNGDGNGRVGGCVRTWPNSGPYALVPGRLTVSRIKAMALSGAFAMREAEKASSDLMYRLHGARYCNVSLAKSHRREASKRSIKGKRSQAKLLWAKTTPNYRYIVMIRW